MMNDLNASAELKKNTLPRRSRYFRRFSLGIKLPIIFLLLLGLALAVSAYLSIKATQSALVETIEKELSAQAETKAEVIRINLTASKSMAVDLAAAAEVARYDEKTILNVIQNTLKNNEQVFGSTIAYEPFQYQLGIYYWAPYFSRDEEGRFKFTQLGNTSYNYFEKDWYKIPKEQYTPILSAPYFDEGGGNIWMVTWSVPFFDQKTGKVKGIATADIAFSQTQEIINEIVVGKKGYAFLLDSQGKILGIGRNGGYYETMKSSMRSLAQEAQNREWESLINAMLTDQVGFTRAVDLQGHPMLVAYTQIGGNTGWSLALAFSEEEIFERASQGQNTIAVYGGLVALVFGVIIYLFTLLITEPLRQLIGQAKEISKADLQTLESKLLHKPVEVRTRDELEDLAEAFNDMTGKIAAAFRSLEEKIADRTKNVERSSLEFSIVAEIARDITIIRDLDTLLNVSVNLIRERFNYYHVGIFLIDNQGEYAVLRAASSIAAPQMLEQNYRLRTGQGLVGNVIRTNQAHIALDVGKDAIHFQNPYLPDTHSEIALPLHSHSVIIGALDIQTTVESAFDERDLNILQLLADLLAAAIENAELSDQVKHTLAELNTTYRSKSQQTWQIEARQRAHQAYEYDGLQVKEMPERAPSTLLPQLRNGQPVIFKSVDKNGNAIKKTLVAPIKILNQIIGVIGLEQEDPEHTWSEADIAIVQAAANRAALTLENARLLEESQRRALKERAIFEATARIGSAMNIENILYATAEEIERVLNSTEVVVQFANNKKK